MHKLLYVVEQDSHKWPELWHLKAVPLRPHHFAKIGYSSLSKTTFSQVHGQFGL